MSVGLTRFINENTDLKKGGKHHVESNVANPQVGSWDFRFPATMKKFTEHLDSARRNNEVEMFSEMQDKVNSGLMIDFDIIMNKKPKKEDVFNGSFYSAFLSATITAISNFDALPQKVFEDGLRVGQKHILAVTEKPKIVKLETKEDGQKTYKFGFHILFPTIGMNRTTKKGVIENLRDYISNNKGLRKLVENLSVVGAPEDIVDKNSAHVPVFFLGCKSKPDKPAYILRHLCEFEIDLEDAKLANDFDRHIVNTSTLKNLRNDWEEDSTRNLVNELALSNSNEIREYKRVLIEPKGKEYAEILRMYGISNDVKKPTEKDLEHDFEESKEGKWTKADENMDPGHLRRLLMGLDIEKRCNDYMNWCKVCWAVESIRKQYKWLSSKDAYNILDEFSRQSDKYKDKDEVIKMAEQSKGQITIGTLWKFLKEDNFLLFKTLQNRIRNGHWNRGGFWIQGGDKYYHTEEELREYEKDKKKDKDKGKEKEKKDADAQESEIPDKYKAEIELMRSPFTNSDVKEYFIKKWGSEFRYYDKVFYHFNGNYWEKEDDDESLVKKISTSIFSKCIKVLNKHFSTVETSDLHAKYSKKLCGLRNEKPIKSTIKLIRSEIVMKDEHFDMNPSLLGFKNGVFDLETGTFRPGKPEDLISITTGYDYVAADVEDMPEKIKFMESWLRQIMADPAEYEFLLKVLASGLCGINIRYFIIFTGRTKNGKSTITEYLMKSALGKYYTTGATSALQESKQNVLSPELAKMDKRRLIVYAEADSSKPLNGNLIKKFVGSGDEITARTIYSSKTETHNFGTHIINTNDIPKVKPLDAGVTGRILVLRFKTWFATEKDMEEMSEEQKKEVIPANGDCTSKEFQRKYRMAIMHLLFKAYQSLKADKFEFKNIPKSVKEDSEKYFNASDEFLVWFNQTFEHKPEEPGNVFSGNELWKKFKDVHDRQVLKEWDKDKFQERLRSYPMIWRTHSDRYKKGGVDKRDAYVGWTFRGDD